MLSSKSLLPFASLLLLSLACQPKKKADDDIISGGNSTGGSGSTTSGSTTGGSSTGGSSTGGTSSGTPTAGGGTAVTDTFGILFKTTTTVNGGHALTAADPATGYTAFDDICMSDAQTKGLRPGLFKAMAGAVWRDPGNVWVLKANTQYRREDKTTVIGTTNGSKTFDFPLTNSITPGTAYTPIWTGLTDTWQNPNFPFMICTRLSDSTATGSVGNATATTDFLLDDGTYENCTQTLPFICAKILGTTTTYPAQASYRRVFLSPTNVQFETNNAKGRLDSYCQAEADRLNISSDGHTKFKSFHVSYDASNSARDLRKVCDTDSCATLADTYDWVFEPNTQYRRLDGTVIGTTNAYGYFNFPLTNSFTGTSDRYWTGISENWGPPASYRGCSNFNSDSPAAQGNYGQGDQVDSTSIFHSFYSCALSLKVLCIEQTRPGNEFYVTPGYTF